MRKISIGDTFKKEKEWILSNNDNFHTWFIINQGKYHNGIRITR
jgi:hypothetical protein